jgi:hypothetical protein
MRTSLTSVFLVALLSLALPACSGSTDPPPAPSGARDGASLQIGKTTARAIAIDRAGSTPDAAPTPSGDCYVWTREGEEDTVTYHLDANGRTIERLDGIVIATTSGAWQWQVEDRPVPTVPCEHHDDEGHVFAGEPAEPGAATRASLRHLGSGAEQIIIDPGADLMGNADVQHDVGVIASIGPFLFLEESTYAYGCGAHGNTGVATTIWNASTGTAVALPMDLGSLEVPRGVAMAELTDEDDDAFAPTDENLELTEIVPRFAPDGTLVLGLQFTAPTCYACTRGGWGSYTKSTIVDAPALPALFVQYAAPPAAVRAFLRAHPEVAIQGWSASSPAGVAR